MASMKMGLGEDLGEKLKDIGWWVVVTLLRWLLERFTSNPGPGENGADHEE